MLSFLPAKYSSHSNWQVFSHTVELAAQMMTRHVCVGVPFAAKTFLCVRIFVVSIKRLKTRFLVKKWEWIVYG